MIPEGKTIFLAMLINEVYEASTSDLQEMANAPLHEVSLGIDALRTAKVNVNRSINRITLADEWKV